MNSRFRVAFIDGTWGIPMTIVEVRELGLIEGEEEGVGTIWFKKIIEYARDHLWFHPWREEIFQVVPLIAQSSILLHGRSRW